MTCKIKEKLALIIASIARKSLPPINDSDFANVAFAESILLEPCSWAFSLFLLLIDSPLLYKFIDFIILLMLSYITSPNIFKTEKKVWHSKRKTVSSLSSRFWLYIFLNCSPINFETLAHSFFKFLTGLSNVLILCFANCPSLGFRLNNACPSYMLMLIRTNAALSTVLFIPLTPAIHIHNNDNGNELNKT